MRGIFTLLALLHVSILAAASSRPHVNCSTLLQGEFNRAPDDEHAGLITRQVPLSTTTLLEAYRRGIFPWGPAPDGHSSWHSPPERGVLFLSDVQIPRKDRQFIRRAEAAADYRITFDQAFTEVIDECAQMVRWATNPRTGEREPEGQWLTPEYIEKYTELHKLGYAHSVEVWHNDILVAGLYGTFVDGVFSGESMFHKEDDAAKLALHALIERLKSRGHQFIDTQQSKGLIKKWGGILVPRQTFAQMLQQAQARRAEF